MSNNTIYNENNSRTVESRYYKAYKKAQHQKATQTNYQQPIKKEVIQPRNAKPITIQNPPQESIKVKLTQDNLDKPNNIQSRYYKAYKEAQHPKATQSNDQQPIKKEIVQPRKEKTITAQQKSIETKPKKEKKYKPSKIKTKQRQQKETSKLEQNEQYTTMFEEKINKFICFIEGLTVKKSAKFIAIGGIISYIIGYLYGQHLGKDLTEKLEKKKRIEEELVISNKPEEYSLTENQIVSDSTSSKENVEKKEYAYAYNFANNIMEEKYGINISYDNELESNIKTLKRTI